MKSNTWLWIISLLLLSGTVHAEGGCPPGQYPITGQGWETCNPIPGYAQNQGQAATAQPPQQPPERWQDHWGAISTDSVKGSLGTAVNMPSQSQAEQAAFAGCQAKGGTACKQDIAYLNQCAAMVVGESGYNTKAGARVADAVQAAMKVCSAATTHCHVYYSACSLPVRIQ